MPDTPKNIALEQRLLRENTSFRPELDFLRAAAVIMVVIDHASLAFHRQSILGLSVGWLGVIGVWIFFVHTALVLMWSLERKPYTLDFYVRRIFRIYPLLLVAITVAVLLHAPLTGTVDNFFQYHKVTFANFIAVGLLIYNLAPAHYGFHPIVGPAWTLPLEVEMYILLPCIFAFYRRSRALWPLILGWVFACGVLSNLAQGISFLTSIPNFLPGIIAYAGYAKFRPRLSPWLLPPALAVAVIALLHNTNVRKGWLFSMALGISLPFFRSFSRSIFTRICHEVAKYSYGIYLVHPFALWLGYYLLPGKPVALQLSIIIATIAVLSVASYHLVEAPMIRAGSRVAAGLETRPIFGERERSLA